AAEFQPRCPRRLFWWHARRNQVARHEVYVSGDFIIEFGARAISSEPTDKPIDERSHAAGTTVRFAMSPPELLPTQSPTSPDLRSLSIFTARHGVVVLPTKTLSLGWAMTMR